MDRLLMPTAANTSVSGIQTDKDMVLDSLLPQTAQFM